MMLYNADERASERRADDQILVAGYRVRITGYCIVTYWIQYSISAVDSTYCFGLSLRTRSKNLGRSTHHPKFCQTMTTTAAADQLPSAEASLALGDSHFIDEDYEDALNAYAITLSTTENDSTKFRAYSHKAATLLQLNRHEEALQDCRRALKGFSGGLREGETEACRHRIGVALFRLERYDEAQTAFEQAVQLGSLNKRDTKKHEEYIQRCKTLVLESQAVVVEEEEEKLIVEEVDKKAPARLSSLKPAPASVVVATTNKKPTMPKYQYYQSDKVMTIAILEPNVEHEDISVTFATKKLTVILTKQGVDFTVICGKLFDKVITEKCKVVIKDEKVLVKLRKSDPHDWHELFSKSLHDDKDDMEVNQKKPAATTTDPEEIPTVQNATAPRPYSSHRDWNAIERNLKEQEKLEKPEGEEAMKSLFEQIYAKADDTTKRAMVKSYQTSGGTVLSTNWKEVKDKDYEKEREAPKGMEWKTWEGDKDKSEKK